MTTTSVSISGLIGGNIWMPCAFCSKSFELSERDFNYSDNSRPSIRDMVLRATNDGDFQGASIVEATVTFNRVETLPNFTTITRRRDMNIRSFQSVSDCVFELDSDNYYSGLDAAYGSEEEDF